MTEQQVAGWTAEDVEQEAMARALAQPPPDGNWAPWVERIRRNLLIDRWRRARAVEPPTPTPVASAEDALLAAERRRAVRRELRRLPPDQRRAVLLRYFVDETPDRAAARLAVSAPTVRTRVHRALQRLRASLGQLRALVPAWGSAAPAALMLVASLHAPPVVATIATEDPAPPSRHARPVAFQLVPHAPAAQPAPTRAAPPQPQPPPRPQRFDFEADTVEGDLQRPDGIAVTAAKPAPQSSLIEIRGDFVPEILKSLDDL